MTQVSDVPGHAVWIVQLRARRGYHKTVVAVAAKNARIAWALLAKSETLRPTADA